MAHMVPGTTKSLFFPQSDFGNHHFAALFVIFMKLIPTVLPQDHTI